MPLTISQVKHAKPKEKDYKLFDEKGLFLLVKKNGSQYWRLKYRYGGKEKTLALGVFPEVSLADARSSRDDARTLLRQGIDPSVQRKTEKLYKSESTNNSFENIANEWFQTHIEPKSDSYKRRTRRLLDVELFPHIGSLPITEISVSQLLPVLKKIENRGVIDTAHKTKQTAGKVFQYAIATGRVERNPANDLSGALRPVNTVHFAAITTPLETGRLMLAINAYHGTAVVQAALKLSALFFLRPGELNQLEWSEINWEKERFELPDSKMKMRKEHIVPISRQAMKIIKQLKYRTGTKRYLFPSQAGKNRPMSKNTIRTALRTMGYDDQTMSPHGFRAMARTLLDEELDFRIEWIEQQLAHEVKDPNGRAYNRTKHLKQRTEMMQAWADYLDQLKERVDGKNVIAADFG